MKPIIYAADPHLDNRNPDISMDGLYVREREALDMFDALGTLALTEGAGAIILAGDLSHYRNPRAWAYVVFLRFLMKCKAAGIVVHAIRGNHDGDDLNRREFGEAFGSLLHYYTKPTVVEVCGRSILMLPWAGRSNIAARAGHSMSVSEQHTYMRDSFERIIASKPADVVVTHFSIAGVSYSTEAQPLLGDSSEFMLPISIFNQPDLQYVISGHVHKAQVLDGGAVPILYPGSMNLCDFGQETEHPQVVIARDGLTPIHVPLEYDHLRFATVGIDDETLPVAGAIVRLKGAVPSGDEGARIVAERLRQIDACSPLYVAKPVLTLTRHEARFAHSITADITPESAFVEYCTLVGGEYQERFDALMPLHQEIERGIA